MLYNLDFLQKGKQFPPDSEVERLQDYKDNLQLFNADTFNLFKKYYRNANKRLMQILNTFEHVIYSVELNYHRLTSCALADLICGEPPLISINNGLDINELLTNTRFPQKLTKIIIDLSRFGDAVVRLYKNRDNQSAVAIYSPDSLVKVVNREDIDDVINYVIAQVIETEDSTEDTKKYNLNVQIHYKGYYVAQIYNLKNNTVKDNFFIDRTQRMLHNIQLFEIGDKIDEKVIKTGLKVFAIVTLHQLLTSDDCYGHSDYDVLDPILSEIWARLGQIALILDKHARPDMYADENCFRINPTTNEVTLKSGGNAWAVEKDGVIPGYVTWDGQLSACFMELDKLVDQLYKLSEMGAIYESAKLGSGQIAVETMKASFVRPLSKARRIVNGIEPAVKKIIAALLELNGKTVKTTDISIIWYDGLPNDEKQEIEKAQMKIQSNLSSPTYENINRFGMRREEAENLAEEIKEEQANTMGLNSMATFYGDDNEEEETGNDEDDSVKTIKLRRRHE